MKYIYIITLIMGLQVSNILAQPCTNAQEFNRKRHWVGGTWGHPYTMFDRHNGISFDSTVKLIRKRIYNEKVIEGQVYLAYQLVYNNAVGAMPSDNGMITED